MSEFKIENVPYSTQRDNYIQPLVSCFPTSVGMAIQYCLQLLDLDKRAIGCDDDTQIEDYLNEIIYDYSTKKWMEKNTGRLGNWIWSYKRRSIFVIEEYVFNRLMNDFGYKATFNSKLTFDEYKDKIEETTLPIILGADFSSISSVKGHIVCGIGYNDLKLEEIICHDPYKNFTNSKKAYTKDKNGIEYLGREAKYPMRFFRKNKAGHMYSLIIEKI